LELVGLTTCAKMAPAGRP